MPDGEALRGEADEVEESATTEAEGLRDAADTADEADSEAEDARSENE